MPIDVCNTLSVRLLGNINIELWLLKVETIFENGDSPVILF